jgi:HAD superfamily hydrolase (TIGR01456 family)
MSCTAEVGIVFDIDGVLMRDWHLIGRSDEAVQRVQSTLKLPFVFVTNGGGVPERKKQAALAQLLGIDVALDQAIICHTPFRAHLESLAPEQRVLAVGLTPERARLCARAYDVSDAQIVTLEDVVDACPELIVPEKRTEAQRAVFAARHAANDRSWPFGVISHVLLFEEPADWQIGAQIIIDVANSPSGSPFDQWPLHGGGGAEQRVVVLLSNPDISYRGTFSEPRLTLGAFGLVLRALFERQCGGRALRMTHTGKPEAPLFRWALRMLEQQRDPRAPPLRRIYVVGDNTLSDIAGAVAMRAAGDERWRGVLLRTGNFQGTDEQGVAAGAFRVCDDVWAAVAAIEELEGL